MATKIALLLIALSPRFLLSMTTPQAASRRLGNAVGSDGGGDGQHQVSPRQSPGAAVMPKAFVFLYFCHIAPRRLRSAVSFFVLPTFVLASISVNTFRRFRFLPCFFPLVNSSFFGCSETSLVANLVHPPPLSSKFGGCTELGSATRTRLRQHSLRTCLLQKRHALIAPPPSPEPLPLQTGWRALCSDPRGALPDKRGRRSHHRGASGSWIMRALGDDDFLS